MTEKDKKKITRFFNGTATPDEAEWVLEWFETAEGELYLDAALEKDIDELLNTRNEDTAGTRNKNRQLQIYPPRKSRPYLAVSVAAALIITLSLSLFFVLESALQNGEATTEKIEYSTGQGEHRVLTLSDGSRIRLNEGSSLHVPESFSAYSRHVDLKGEAYFEISNDQNSPFTVTVMDAHVEVLGTSFVIKQQALQNATLVAVSEGVVSFGPGETGSGEAVRLHKNMVGYYDTLNGILSSQEMDVRNYLSWFNGRIVFDGEPFSTVINQLGHLYDKRMILDTEELNDLRLTADISATSMDEVFETIGETLQLQYSTQQDTVKWKHDSQQ